VEPYTPLGDPFMLLSSPAGQYLERYVFNTDSTFDYDELILIRPPGAQVEVDCLGLIADSEFTPVGASPWEVARVYLDHVDGVPGCVDGAHWLIADQPVFSADRS
jgi:hypothetical protein